MPSASNYTSTTMKVKRSQISATQSMYSRVILPDAYDPVFIDSLETLHRRHELPVYWGALAGVKDPPRHPVEHFPVQLDLLVFIERVIVDALEEAVALVTLAHVQTVVAQHIPLDLIFGQKRVHVLVEKRS